MNITDKKLHILGEVKVSKALLTLGIPTMIGMMVSALYSVVDAYFVSGLGTSQTGAVAVVFPIVQIIVGLGMTFGSGAASYISRLLGAGQSEQANKTAASSLYTSLAVGIAAIGISLIFLDGFLATLGATKTILPYAREYAVIYIGGSILNIFNITMNNIVTAEGKAKLTMTSMLIGGGLNVILDPIFIYTLNFGIQGAAIATVVSQAATACLYLWFIAKKKSILRFSPKFFSFEKTLYTEVLKVGVPILVFQILASLAMGLSNTAASLYGDSAVAAVGVVTRIMTLGTYIVFGYMKGYQPLAGYSFGAKQYARLLEATNKSLKWATLFCTLSALMMVLMPATILSLFTKTDTEMITIGSKILRANGFVFPLYGFQMVYMALFLALGKAKQGGLLSISRQGIFFIPLILILPRFFGLFGIIWAQPAADILTIILTLVFAASINQKLNTLAEQFKYKNL